MRDGNLNPLLSSSDRNQYRISPSAKYAQDSEDSDDTQSDEDVNWSLGDGICPTTAQFNLCFQSKLDEWERAASLHFEAYGSLILCTRAFLDLLKGMPNRPRLPR